MARHMEARMDESRTSGLRVEADKTARRLLGTACRRECITAGASSLHSDRSAPHAS